MIRALSRFTGIVFATAMFIGANVAAVWVADATTGIGVWRDFVTLAAFLFVLLGTGATVLILFPPEPIGHISPNAKKLGLILSTAVFATAFAAMIFARAHEILVSGVFHAIYDAIVQQSGFWLLLLFVALVSVLASFFERKN